MAKSLIILRGLPGSGKTTFAKLIGKAVCSADDYLYIGTDYVWTNERVILAHRWCERKCERYMKIGAEKVVIANVFVKSSDMKPYRKLARLYGYDVFSIIVENRHGGINSHNVSKEKFKSMKDNFNIQL